MQKRATINVSPELRRELKKRALDADMPLYEYVEGILSDFLGDLRLENGSDTATRGDSLSTRKCCDNGSTNH